MGVTKGSKALHRIKDLSRAEFTSIARGLSIDMKTRPIILVDVSNLLYGVHSKVKSAAEYLFELASTGLTISPVCDNNIRPSVKQATIKRRSNREKARGEEILLRQEIRGLRQRLDKESLTNQQRSEVFTEIRKKELRRKRKETASYSPLHPNFSKELETELILLGAHSINEAGGSALKVITAEYQADLYMAGQLLAKKAIMVLSTDTDIPLLTGDSCISINGFSSKKIELMSTSKATLEKAMAHAVENAGSNATLVPADLPIFDNVKNHRLRAVMILICGCDVYTSGLKGTSITSLSKHISLFKTNSTASQCEEAKLLDYLTDIMKSEFKPQLIEEVNEIVKKNKRSIFRYYS